MNVDGEKIRTLIEVYGKERDYPQKSYLSKFCEDNEVNYSQWNAHIGGRQVVGTKILDKLMYVFPNLNMNWLLKDEGNIFVGEENIPMILNEPEEKYSKKIGQEDIYNKLDDILIEIKKINSKEE